MTLLYDIIIASFSPKYGDAYSLGTNLYTYITYKVCLSAVGPCRDRTHNL